MTPGSTSDGVGSTGHDLPPPDREPPTLSVLDLAVVRSDGTVREALEGSVELARAAERLGFRRVWYAEHHNMSSIASSATSVLIAHVAAHTESIRLGAGGIMLPNHSPLTIAEQFGTLATLHPGRIDLGLGRAPGTDQVTLHALRRSPNAAEHFPQDVLELQGFLGHESRVPGVRAVPGEGTLVPLYILGSSLFGASLAARLGLPYGFASHFAPEALTDAVALYRREFRPSEQLAEPHVVAGVNVIVDSTEAAAEEELRRVTRARVAAFLARDRSLTDEQLDRLMESPNGAQIARMMTYTTAGTSHTVWKYLLAFAEHADADELMIVPASRGAEARVTTLEGLADAAAHLDLR